MSGRGRRALKVLGLLGLGVLCGVAVGIPAVMFGERWWGLPAAVVLTALWAYVLGPVARIGFTLGWLGPVLTGAMGRGEGDYLVAASVRGYLLLAVGFLLILATVVTSARPRRRAESLERAESGD